MIKRQRQLGSDRVEVFSRSNWWWICSNFAFEINICIYNIMGKWMIWSKQLRADSLLYSLTLYCSSFCSLANKLKLTLTRNLHFLNHFLKNFCTIRVLAPAIHCQSRGCQSQNHGSCVCFTGALAQTSYLTFPAWCFWYSVQSEIRSFRNRMIIKG